MTLRMSDADYAAYMAKHKPLHTKAEAPRQRAPQDAYAAIVLPTAEPPSSVTLDDLPLLPLPAQRQQYKWVRGWKTKFRRSLAKAVAAGIGGQWRYRPYKFGKVTVTRFSSHRPDQDNLIASCKELLDVLQVMSARCPDGLGLLIDDSVDCCELVVNWSKVPPKNGFTMVEICEVENAM